jgi:predicted RNA-binding Zn ribbon-like protein
MGESAESRFLFVGNLPCMDFVNTDVMSGGARTDLLGSFAGFREWLAAAGLPDKAGIEGTEADFAEVLAFRKVLRDMVEQISRGGGVDDASLDAINALLRRPVRFDEVDRAGDGFVRRVVTEISEPVDLLVPVAHSAADLLASGDLSLVKKCGNPDCILYFYDTTKNHKRNWCRMGACGNRSKVAAHYQRKRSSRTDG